jgi:NADPH:quinone reductase-like Zn-dependent oxidoreductase
MATQQDLPKTHRALFLTSISVPPEVKTLPTPQPGPGSITARMSVVSVLSYSKEIYNGTRVYPLPFPLVSGTSGIGRIAAIGPDTTALKPGQLVFVDSFM